MADEITKYEVSAGAVHVTYKNYMEEQEEDGRMKKVYCMSVTMYVGVQSSDSSTLDISARSLREALAAEPPMGAAIGVRGYQPYAEGWRWLRDRPEDPYTQFWTASLKVLMRFAKKRDVPSEEAALAWASGPQERLVVALRAEVDRALETQRRKEATEQANSIACHYANEAVEAAKESTNYGARIEKIRAELKAAAERELLRILGADGLKEHLLSEGYEEEAIEGGLRLRPIHFGGVWLRGRRVLSLASKIEESDLFGEEGS